MNTAEDIESLEWVVSADVIKETNQAIAKQDYRLYKAAGRGEKIFGLDTAIAKEYAQRCGTQYLQGSTDLIRDDEHMKFLIKAHEYAKKYNQIMVKNCFN